MEGEHFSGVIGLCVMAFLKSFLTIMFFSGIYGLVQSLAACLAYVYMYMWSIANVISLFFYRKVWT